MPGKDCAATVGLNYNRIMRALLSGGFHHGKEIEVADYYSNVSVTLPPPEGFFDAANTPVESELYELVSVSNGLGRYRIVPNDALKPFVETEVVKDIGKVKGESGGFIELKNGEKCLRIADAVVRREDGSFNIRREWRRPGKQPFDETIYAVK